MSTIFDDTLFEGFTHKQQRPSASTAGVFSHDRDQTQPPLFCPPDLTLDAPNEMEGLCFLSLLEHNAFPLCILDPQYRGVLDHQQYGNEGERQPARSSLRQMDGPEINNFIVAIESCLMPSGHLMLWLDKFHLVVGITEWLAGTSLAAVDLIVWNKLRFGMGYRSRRVSEYLLVLQKQPKRAKGCWTLHDMPDVWNEEAPEGTHAKPLLLQQHLISCVTRPGETLLDPCAGTYTSLKAALNVGRHALCCDIQENQQETIV